MNYFVIDFEFTFYKRPVGRPRGFFNEIIEAGAVLLDSRGAETGRMHAFVKPHFYPKQAKDAYDFCMITEKEMKNTPGNCYFVTWGNEDFRVLDIGCQRHGIENPVRREDCLDLALAYRLWKDDSFTTGLKAAAEALETDSEGLWHTAYDDAFNTGRVLFKMLEKGWSLEDFLAAQEMKNQQAAT